MESCPRARAALGWLWGGTVARPEPAYRAGPGSCWLFPSSLGISIFMFFHPRKPAWPSLVLRVHLPRNSPACEQRQVGVQAGGAWMKLDPNPIQTELCTVPVPAGTEALKHGGLQGWCDLVPCPEGDAVGMEPCVDQPPKPGPCKHFGKEWGCQWLEEGAGAHTAFPWQGSPSWGFS